MEVTLVTCVSILISYCVLVSGQAANTLKGVYPNYETQSVNGSFFILGVDREVVASMTGEYGLLSLENDATFGDLYADGKHPVLVIPGTYKNDIQMGALNVPYLLSGGFIVPYVDGTGDNNVSKPCGYSYFAAVNGAIPAIVGTLAYGTNTSAGNFIPSDAAYSFVDPYFQNQIKIGVPAILDLFPFLSPFLATAPSVLLPVLDALFTPASEGNYSADVYKAILNQPLISNQGTNNCIDLKYIFDDTYVEDTGLVTGNTIQTYYPFLPSDGALGDSSTFSGVPGFRGVAQMVVCGGLVPQTCASVFENSPGLTCPTT